ncbi:MAG: hypothetical protein M2R46_05506 [Verrucomicrobia subdivision 3 bacterium]|nr:hypothetical protein [Limisphaerales bacterium]
MPELNFKGKEFVRNHHLSVPHRLLEPDAKKSAGKPQLAGNLIVHGDNLHALKSLLPMYAGKVNCIYIDPPYNTGNENWCYNDNVNSPTMQSWLNQNPVGIEDGLRHDKWCAMMWPRLMLLRELLTEDGVIFISIDDNEQHRLRMMMDEIFGADNVVANIIWEKRYAPTNDAKYFSSNHDFVLCYAKKKNQSGATDGWKRQLLPRTDKQNKLYKYDDNDGRGPWRSGDLSVKTYSEEYDYRIVNPITNQEHFPPQGRCWITSKENMHRWIAENRVFFGKDGKGAPQLKRYLSEVQQGIVPLTIWTYGEVGHTDGARKMLKQIFSDSDSPFDNPKALGLLERVISIGTEKEALILDSFAGSGTTAHAVLALNKEDGGNRKFILVECEDYADTITAERVRRVIKGVPGTKDKALQEGLGGEFTFCTLGKAIAMDDLLSGKHLPSFAELGKLLFHTATNEVINPAAINPETGYLGMSSSYHIWLIYQPNMGFLKSNDAALTLDKAKEITKAKRDNKRHLVFASSTFVSQKSSPMPTTVKGSQWTINPSPSHCIGWRKSDVSGKH